MGLFRQHWLKITSTQMDVRCSLKQDVVMIQNNQMHDPLPHTNMASCALVASCALTTKFAVKKTSRSDNRGEDAALRGPPAVNAQCKHFNSSFAPKPLNCQCRSTCVVLWCVSVLVQHDEHVHRYV